MKSTNSYSYKTNAPPRQTRKACQALALVALIGAAWNPAECRAAVLAADGAPPPTGAVASDKDVQGLTRGPVHEACAGTITFNPEPGVVVPKAPPAAIEEVPPGERPVGTNVTWIPGYWAWDEERTDFLWVSGTWRALPPGRQWMAGYWGQVTDGYQWTSGYWADTADKETTYLAAPPATVEDGPNVAAPSADYRWTPGNWVWNDNRYAWGPGYWARGRADWDWSPSHYMWTPRGYVFVSGYWDYPVSRRGSLFAPVYFDSGVYSHAGYSYSPSIAIDLGVLAEALFVRPRYNHYYFGDYYDNSYQQGGYYSAYAYQSSGVGYDSIYSRQRWSHRGDAAWNTTMGASYQYRRDNLSARPPRTWAAQQAVASTASFQQNRMLVATPLAQMTRGKNSSMKYQAVSTGERQALAQRSQQMAVSSDQRRTVETKGPARASLKPGELMAPSTVQHARSPIVAKAPSQLGKGNAPPAAQRSPRPQAAIQPATAAGARSSKGDPTRPQADPRQPQAQPQPRQAQPQPQPRQPAAAPAAKGGGAPRGGGGGQPAEKDPKGKAKE